VRDDHRVRTISTTMPCAGTTFSGASIENWREPHAGFDSLSQLRTILQPELSESLTYEITPKVG